MSVTPRLRFAPAPTGFLHLGGARTALFNWLYARRHGGVFVLRIEDTDVRRSSDDLVAGILDGLRWLGIEWDEGPGVGGPHGPYLQSARLESYRTEVDRLLADGRAYRCFCLPEELQQRREAAQAKGGGWMYDRTCLQRREETTARLTNDGVPHAVRFRVPEGRTRFDDLVRGTIDVDNATIEDFVILRSDRHPTYHLSVVVDDIDMAITHVVRGDDHTSNTPKHLLLYDAFGASPPRFAHVPLIFGPDKKRMSKRHGATSVTDYRDRGYLPDAMVNFLALLGWSPGSDQELFTREALVEAFTLEGISGGNAVFDAEKLDWFNGQQIGLMPADVVVDALRPALEAAGLWRDDYAAGGGRRAWLAQVIDLLRSRVRFLADFVEYGRPFLADDVAYEPEAVEKRLSADGLAGHVTALREAYAAGEFTAAALETALRAVAETRGIKAGVLIHATRVGMTGRTVSPGLFEMVELIGRDRTLVRLRALEQFLVERGAVSS
ncbi:MAG: glutamate--tRNA ligase [Vicinamibacterales bacterium]|nr:glutamate--tRNA ligase [Vicinamibacterales bacterium]